LSLNTSLPQQKTNRKELVNDRLPPGGKEVGFVVAKQAPNSGTLSGFVWSSVFGQLCLLLAGLTLCRCGVVIFGDTPISCGMPL